MCALSYSKVPSAGNLEYLEAVVQNIQLDYRYETALEFPADASCLSCKVSVDSCPIVGQIKVDT